MNGPTKDLQYAGGYREMWRIAMPLILSMGAYTLMQFCDRVFLSRYSSVAIQAALPGGILAHTMICLFQTIAGYSSTFTAHHHGARQPFHCIHSTIQGLWMALASWPLILLLTPLGIWLMSISGHTPEVFAAEKKYFTILMVTGILPVLNTAVGGYFMGIGQTRVNFIASLIGCLLNILLNYVMIFGHWGCPELGIAGAAYATALSAFVIFAIQMVLFLRIRDVRTYSEDRRRSMENGIPSIDPSWPRILAPDRFLLTRMLKFGTPVGFQTLLDLASFSLFVLLAGRMGDVAQAASSITLSINHLAFAPLLGFAMAASTMVGQHQGAGNPLAARKAGWTALKMGLIYMVLIGATFILFPRGYFELFSPKDASFTPDELLTIGRKMLILVTIWGLFDTTSLILAGALKGAGDTRFVMIYMAINAWAVFVPGALLLTWFGFGILALWIWFTAYVCFFVVGIWIRWQRGTWQKIRLIHPMNEPIPVLLNEPCGSVQG